MHVCIAGSRDFTDYQKLVNDCAGILNGKGLEPEDVTVISGGARGVDQMGEAFANQNECGLKRFPAQWDTFGKSAGYRRNVVMADVSDLVIIFWDGVSRGTKHMIDICEARGIETIVIKT